MKHTAYAAGIDGINVTTYTDDASEHNVETVPYSDMLARIMDGDYDYDPALAICILKQIMKAEMQGLRHCPPDEGIQIMRYLVTATYAAKQEEVPNEMLPPEVVANEPAGAKSYKFNLDFTNAKTAMTLRTLRNATEMMIDQNVMPQAAEELGKLAPVALLTFYGALISEDDHGEFSMTPKGDAVMMAVVNGIVAKTHDMARRQVEAEDFAADLHQPHTLH